MTDLEDVLRATLRDRERDITSTPQYHLLPPKPTRSRWIALRRRYVPLLAAIAAGVVVVAVAVVANRPPGARPEPAVEPAPRLVGDIVPAPPGLQAVGSRGVELLAPSSWLINDTFCGQSGGPTVVRGRAVGPGDCLTLEPTTKTVAEIGPAELDWYPVELGDGQPATYAPTIALEPVTVDGRPAERGLTRLPDGRLAGLLRFLDEDVAVTVRSTDGATVGAVLDSVRSAPVDSAGCPARRPDALEYLATADADQLAALDLATSATLCSYFQVLDVPPVGQTADQPPLLGSSIVVRGEALDRLVGELGGLSFGQPVDLSCTDPRPEPEVDHLVSLRLADGAVRTLVTAQQGCGLVVLAPTRSEPARMTPGLWSVLAHTVHQGVGTQLADLVSTT